MSSTRSALRPSSWPIAVRMTADLLAAAIVPLAVGLWISTARSVGALERESLLNLELLAQVTATQLDQLLADTRRTVDQVANDDRIVDFCAAAPDARPALAEAVQRRLELVTASNSDYAQIFVTDADGIGVASTSADNVGMDLTFREYWHRGRSGERYISPLLVGTNTRRPGIYFSAPVRDGEEIIGVTILKLAGERVWEIIDEVRVGERGYAALSSDDGVVLAHPDRSILYHSFGPLSPEAIERIDPSTTYGLDAIESLGVPDLMDPLTDADAEGSATFERGAFAESGDDRPETWIVGFAPTELNDWVVSATLPRAQFAAPLLALARQQVLLGVILAALAAIYAIVRARGIVRPILDLTSGAARVSDGDFSTRVETTRDDEIGHLATVFNDMVPRLGEHMELRKSLEVAMEVQQALLPAADPIVDGLEIAGRSRYCDETGGDYFDFIEVSSLGDDAALVALGDVMGHGVGSALLMATARAALRSQVEDRASLADLLSRVNVQLAHDAQHGRFMTMVLLLVDRSARRLRWASAGHDPVIVYRRDTDTFAELDGCGLPLGVIAEESYEEHHRNELHVGEVLLVGTDGIWETRNPDGEMYEKERLKALLREHADRPAAEIATAIESALTSFRGPERVLDDITFVVLRVVDTTASPRTDLR